jgi:hypothetical protein
LLAFNGFHFNRVAEDGLEITDLHFREKVEPITTQTGMGLDR